MLPPKALLLAACLLSATAAVSAMQVLRLHEIADWRLDNGQGFGNVSLDSVTLPATALELLHRAGIVGDPLHRWALPRVLFCLAGGGARPWPPLCRRNTAAAAL